MPRYDREYAAHLFSLDAVADFHSTFGQLPVQMVSLVAITDTNQSGLNLPRLATMLATPDRRPVRLLADGALLTVWDGTHRVVAARVRGDQSIGAHIMVLPASKRALIGGG